MDCKWESKSRRRIRTCTEIRRFEMAANGTLEITRKDNVLLLALDSHYATTFNSPSILPMAGIKILLTLLILGDEVLHNLDFPPSELPAPMTVGRKIGLSEKHQAVQVTSNLLLGHRSRTLSTCILRLPRGLGALLLHSVTSAGRRLSGAPRYLVVSLQLFCLILVHPAVHTFILICICATNSRVEVVTIEGAGGGQKGAGV